jgi:cyclopropane fatty-acyl-phospholipid synthase-like methyltransferase
LIPKVNINERYLEESETNRDDDPYQDFYEVLESVFNMQNVKSFMDVGCADGNLIKIVHGQNPDMDIAGIEYFDYHKKYADLKIVDKMKILDIRDDLPSDLLNKNFDIVVCTEIGEHIDPAYTTAFLENIKKLVGKYLIMTWSRHGGEKERHKDPHHQHLNPLEFDQFMKVMSDHGFLYDQNLTIASHHHIESKKSFHFWWKESFTVWQK